jgi:hypothetical protein
MRFLTFSLLSIVFFSFNVQAQTQGVSYTAVGKGVATTFVTDYHALGINTSALGWGTGYENKKFTIGLTEFGAGIYSDALNVTRLKNFSKSIRNAIAGNTPTQYDFAAQKQAAMDYSTAGVSMFANWNWFGFSFYNEKFGGIAVNVSENYRWYSKLSVRTADFIFNGRLAEYFDSLTIVVAGDTSVIANSLNLSQDTLSAVIQGSIAYPLMLSDITKGSEIRSSWNRHYNFGYGRKILGRDSMFVLYGGIGGRFIQSVAMFNMESTDDGLYMYSSVTPNFNIDYDSSVVASNVSAYFERGKVLPKVVGTGYGLDFSASMVFFNRLKVAAAVNNIGQVTYNRNVYRVLDTLVTNVNIDGLNDYNVTQAVNQLLNQGGIMTLEGQEKYTVLNAADVRIGASFSFGKIASVGFDMVAPFNRNAPGNIANPVFSFGGEIRPLPWLHLNAGYFGGGIYKNNIPLGVNFSFKEGTYEFGLASYDILSFFLDNSNSLSAAFGMARIRF